MRMVARVDGSRVLSDAREAPDAVWQVVRGVRRGGEKLFNFISKFNVEMAVVNAQQHTKILYYIQIYGPNGVASVMMFWKAPHEFVCGQLCHDATTSMECVICITNERSSKVNHLHFK